jgi:hypothetical protein
VCAEHGELIHVDAGTASARNNRHDPQDSASAYRPTGNAETTDARDHCLISAVRKETLVVHAAPVAFLPVRALQGVATSEREVALPRAVAILHLAPKSSPPARLV